MIEVRAVAKADRPSWFRLWNGYLDFYETKLDPKISDATWRRLLDSHEPIHGLVACDSNHTVIGLANYVLHANTWTERPVCYLEDLFVDPNTRGHGAGRALIDAVVERARTSGWLRVYWQTKQNNATARRLYDQVAQQTDWVRYDIAVSND